MRATGIGIAVICILFAGLAYLELSPHEKPFPQLLPPFLPAVASCKALAPGMTRIGKDKFFNTRIRFDVPTEDFTISEKYCTDAPPPACSLAIKPKSGTAYLGISWGEETIERRPPDPPRTSSGVDSSAFAGTRRIADDKGKTIGQESWGYWGQGQRWRRVHLLGQAQAKYGSKNEMDACDYGSVQAPDAALFDQIISSACWSSSPDD
jgi:hypothetical protein